MRATGPAEVERRYGPATGRPGGRGQAENCDGTAAGRAETLSMHSRFSGTVGVDQTENLTFVYFEGDFVDGNSGAVGFANSRNLDDRGHVLRI